MDRGVLLICLALIAPTVTVATNATDDGDLPYTLTYEPEIWNPGITEKFELRCDRVENVKSSMVVVMWMRIVKQTGQRWNVVAEQRDGGSQTEDYGGVSSSGILVPVDDAFLSVVWSKPTDNVTGSYKCLTFGLDDHNHFVVTETRTVVIKARKLSEIGLLNIILDSEENLRDTISQNTREISDTAISLDLLSQNLDQNTTHIEDRLDKESFTVESIINGLLFPKPEEIWPGGTYGLLKPDSGCPLDMAFYNGNTGYFRLHSESSTTPSENSHTMDSHLSKPIITSYSINTFVNLRFCVANGMYNSGEWPDGRYCIHKKGNCPKHFEVGYVNFKTESWGNLDTAGGNHVDSEPSRMDFCCRTSGNPTIPIALPTRHPFYLYQYDGRCQQVKDMNVTEEYLQVDTEEGSSASNNHPYLPTGRIGDRIRLELCYYTKY